MRGARGTGGARPEGGRPFSLERGPRGAALAREGVGGLEMPSVEPFTRPVPRDFAQDVMDAHLAQVDPDEMA
ncbi:MAG TPA: hypothetical protein VM890_07355 [Longimicrobium sp.]|nr:hypothetical protein [Longimicrobium sp.]